MEQVIRANLEDVFMHAAAGRKLCEIIDFSGHRRIVESYGIFLSSKKQPEFCCFQVKGYSASGHIPNWRNIKISDIKSITVLDESFAIREDFNPDNNSVYPKWLYRI